MLRLGCNMIVRWLMPVMLASVMLWPGAARADKGHGLDKNVMADLEQLDKLLKNRDDDLAIRLKRIEALKAKAAGRPSAAGFREISDAYEDINSDSAIVYLERAMDICTDSLELNLCRMRLAAVLPLGCFFEDAENIYADIDTTLLSQEQMVDYYRCGRDMYYNFADFFQDSARKPELLREKVAHYQSLYLNALRDGPDDNDFRIALGEHLLYQCRYDDAATVLRDVLQTESGDTHIRSRSAALLSRVAKHKGDTPAYIHYLTLAIGADIHRGSVDLPSLHNLAMALHGVGDEDRAYRYMHIAAEDANRSGVKARQLQASTAAPLIQDEHVATLERSRLVLTITLIALAVTVAIIGVILLRARRETRKLRAASRSLDLAARKKEVHISQALSLCLLYMDRMRHISLSACSKLAAGKTDEVTRMLQADKLMDEHTEAFFNVFDDAFLSIYPTFVRDVNALLQPDKKIELREGERLNTDLRILAFMRMGLDDTGRIAQIQGYAVNTIYAYRNKLRNRAINRDTFEEDIMKIGL